MFITYFFGHLTDFFLFLFFFCKFTVRWKLKPTDVHHSMLTGTFFFFQNESSVIHDVFTHVTDILQTAMVTSHKYYDVNIMQDNIMTSTVQFIHNRPHLVLSH